MVDRDVDLGVPGTNAFETFERGETVLYVVHDRETNEGVYELRQLLNPRRAPDGRYGKIWLKPKGDPNADWS
jgi:hypothetical protein